MDKIVRNKWSIFIWINILWCLGSLALGYIAYTSSPPSGSTKTIETIKVVFLSLGGLGVILPVFLNIINSMEERIEQKIENTFKLLEKWDDPHLFSARKLTREMKNKKPETSDNELIEQVKSNSELLQSVHLVLNYFEHIRFSINTNRIDLELFKKSLGPVVVDIIDRFMPYIKEMGKQYKIDIEELRKHLS